MPVVSVSLRVSCAPAGAPGLTVALVGMCEYSVMQWA